MQLAHEGGGWVLSVTDVNDFRSVDGNDGQKLKPEECNFYGEINGRPVLVSSSFYQKPRAYRVWSRSQNPEQSGSTQ